MTSLIAHFAKLKSNLGEARLPGLHVFPSTHFHSPFPRWYYFIPDANFALRSLNLSVAPFDNNFFPFLFVSHVHLGEQEIISSILKLNLRAKFREFVLRFLFVCQR